MKTLKNSKQDVLAVVTETTVYLSNLEGKIYKFFPVQHFKDADFTEEVEFPGNFTEAKKAFDAKQADKRRERDERNRLAEIARRELEAQKQAAFEEWKRGETEAWKIYTCDEPLETFEKNPAYEGTFETGVFGKVHFGSEEEMNSIVDDMIGSWNPEFDDSPNNVQGRISLYKIKAYDSMEIEDYDELEDCEIGDSTRDEWFSIKLPDDCYIVDVEMHYGNFNRKYYTPSAIYRKGDSIFSSYKTRTLIDYSDLWDELVFDSIYEIYQEWGEDSVKLLKSEFSEEELREAMGDNDYDFYFAEDEESDTEE